MGKKLKNKSNLYFDHLEWSFLSRSQASLLKMKLVGSNPTFPANFATASVYAYMQIDQW
jgi:hypothetical protein